MPFNDIILENEEKNRKEMLYNYLANKKVANNNLQGSQAIANPNMGAGYGVVTPQLGEGLANFSRNILAEDYKPQPEREAVKEKPKINTEPKINKSLLDDKYYQDFLRVQGGKGKQPEEGKIALVNTKDSQPEYEDDGGVGDNISRALALIGGGMSSYGTALRGGDTSGVAKNMIGTLNEISGRKDERAMNDPNSPISIEARNYMKKMLPDQPINEKLSAKQIFGISPYIQKMYEADMGRKELSNQERSIFLKGQPKGEGIKKPKNDTQIMAEGFYKRMNNSNNILNDLENKSIDNKEGGFNPSEASNFALFERMKSDERKKYEAAQNDFIMSNLRKESGAAIGKDELEYQKNTYFPQPGDSKDVIKQKQKMRNLLSNNMKRSSGDDVEEIRILNGKKYQFINGENKGEVK